MKKVSKKSDETSTVRTDIPASKDQLKIYKAHLLKRAYMSGVDRDHARIKATAEVFTPNKIVKKLVKKVGIDDIRDPTKLIIDASCGDGQFLSYILWRRLKAAVPLQDALRTIYGIERMPDNHSMCQKRLRCGHEDDEEVRKIIDLNIVCANARTYHMLFDGSPHEPDEEREPGPMIEMMENKKKK